MGNFYQKIAKSFTARTKFLLAIMLGCMLTFGFAPFHFIPATICSLAGLYYLIEQCKSKKEIFKYATAFGFAHFLSSMYWLATPLFADIKSYYFVMPFSLGLTPFILSLFISIPCVLTLYFKNRTAKIFIFAFGITMLELIRTYIIPFPWNLLGYVSAGSKYLMQMVGIVTIHGMTFFIVFTSISLFSKSRKLVTIALTAIFIFTGFGYYLFNKPTTDNSNINIRLVQPNFGYFYDIEYDESYQKFEELLKIMLDRLPDENQLIILPEGSMPFLMKDYEGDMQDQATQLLASIAHEHNTKILLPANYLSEKEQKYYNSLLLIGENGIEHKYFKRILVPFGEYLPLKKLLGYFLTPIATSNGGFCPGRQAAQFEYKGLNFVPSICFESIFPQLFKKKHSIIINVTNDSWLGNTIGPSQHFDMLRFRAIETNSKIIRVANTGLTAIVDEKGNILHYLNINQQLTLDIDQL